MTNKQTIIDDLKEMIYKLQIECVEKTDNILALGEQLKSAEKTIEILEAKIGGHEYAISDIVKEYQRKFDSKEQECERTKERLESFQKDYSKLYQVVENKGYIKELDQLKAENEELTTKLQKYIDREQRDIELAKKRADGFKEMRKMLYGKVDGSSLIEKRNPYEN